MSAAPGAAPPGIEVGRLAARQEGQWWVFRYEFKAKDISIELGRLHMKTVQRPDMYTTAVGFFAQAARNLVEDATGITPNVGEVREAPESERMGNA